MDRKQAKRKVGITKVTLPNTFFVLLYQQYCHFYLIAQEVKITK